MDVINISIDDYVLDEEKYYKILEEDEVWEKIPLINSNATHNFKGGSLVRFRGMIQDMHGPEFYVPQFDVTNETTNTKIVKSGKYRDATECSNGERIDFFSNGRVPDERHCYVVVSIPGINTWVREYEALKYKLKHDKDIPGTSSGQLKRTYDEAMEAETYGESSTVKRTTAEALSNSNSDETLSVSPEYLLNHPLSDSETMGCHIRVYKDSDDLKLNDVCEFVGFLSLNTIQFDGGDLEMQTHNPPTSLVPRIHVVRFKKMLHCNPLIDSSLSDVNYSFTAKKDLLLVLTQLLVGDALAAEYLIYNLISEIYLRRDYMALGPFTLNISNVPQLENIDYVKEVYNFLELFVPKSHYLPFTLENMNILNFNPRKDYECNRLNSGILQLSKNTLLVLDETKLQEGKLYLTGVRGVKALTQAIKNQTVTYDFNYYSLEYHCDIQFLVFSEGKSMLPSDVLVPLEPDDDCLKTFGEIVKAAKHFLKPEILNQIRVYLTRALLVEYEISDQVQELVQQEFVEMRQNGNVTAQDLHSLLVLCRLICISEGKTSLDSVCWKKACEMERKRKARIPK